MANGAESRSMEVAEDEYGPWAFSFDHLAPRDSQGREITYSVAAEEIPGYTVEMEQVGNVCRITYTRPKPVKPTLTITANNLTLEYNGQIQGPGDTVHEDPAEIAELVTAEGLQDGDALTSIVVDGQGKTLKTEKVESGKAAAAPADPKRSGYTFTSWDKDFSKVTADMTVTAQWKKNPAPKPDPKPAPTKVSGMLLSKMTAMGKSSLVLTWNKVKGAEGYDIFFIKCGKQAPK